MYNISGDRKKGFQLSKFMDPDSPSVAWLMEEVWHRCAPQAKVTHANDDQ